jgi:hypothetical protein
VRLREWRSNPGLDFLDAEHTAYSRSGDQIVHRRRILFVKPRYWILVDDLVGTSRRHHVELTFQFAPLHVALGPDRWARAVTPRGSTLWIGPFTSASTSVRTTLTSGELRPIRGWVAPTYGERRPAPMLAYSVTIVPPCRILTLLLPDASGGPASPPPVRIIYDEDRLPAGLLFERSGETVRVDERVVLVRQDCSPCAALPAS